MLSVSALQSHQTDGFDRIPDSLVLLIFNQLSDIKTLIRCGAVSKRFNSLVPQADTLLLKVDRVISASGSSDDDEGDDEDSFLVSFFRSIFKSLHNLVSPKLLQSPTRSQNSPTQILRGFERIRELEIELPSGDLRLEKGGLIRWKAEFGKTLKSCVILGFRSIGDGGAEVDLGGGGGLKMRVVWTISALIAASARHYMLREVVREHRELERLVVRDRDGEGMVVMDKEGLREFRESGEDEEEPRVSGWCGVVEKQPNDGAGGEDEGETRAGAGARRWGPDGGCDPRGGRVPALRILEKRQDGKQQSRSCNYAEGIESYPCK
ncbi:hypothetical protein F0562_013150 [Nyssa sinensis]|uniref:F-box domain-containing protein n=1 Tax=Nyssa sinensis TaxID=561372 RepID=A0A5J4ZVU3_9ASTE|nr:hypothetical protein F0562_013150 [Nyssa sinensis]